LAEQAASKSWKIAFWQAMRNLKQVRLRSRHNSGKVWLTPKDDGKPLRK